MQIHNEECNLKRWQFTTHLVVLQWNYKFRRMKWERGQDRSKANDQVLQLFSYNFLRYAFCQFFWYQRNLFEVGIDTDNSILKLFIWWMNEQRVWGGLTVCHVLFCTQFQYSYFGVINEWSIANIHESSKVPPLFVINFESLWAVVDSNGR